MQEKIQKLLTEIESFKAETKEQLEEFRIRMLGKKGELTDLFADFKNVAAEQRKEVGQKLNEVKTKAQEKIDAFKEKFENTSSGASNLDLTLPGDANPLGTRHPLSIVRNRIIEIFSRIGFTVSEGPEIEDDWHNFSALNFPPEHPARDMQDTFFIETPKNKSSSASAKVNMGVPDDQFNTNNSPEESNPDIALRTHTSSVQVRVMENSKPPIRTISPGRVFRNEAISARAHCIFHQVEGLYIDENVSFADLKQTLLYFAKEMFGEDTKIRLRPSYFPFTEPSAEMDISCNICGGSGCNICKHSGWVEILGCGMVDPNVLENCKIDSQKYTGFAFGMGIERITMLKYQVKDLRLFFENDVRFLGQFKGAV